MLVRSPARHPFRPQCLMGAVDPGEEDDVVAIAEWLVRVIDESQCPRCGSALEPPPAWPAGSRVTDCRCIPVCGPCGKHEALVGLASVAEWYHGPLDPEQIRRELDDPRSGRPHRIHERQVETRPMPRTGSGWSVFGYDAEQDAEERQG